MTDALNPAGPAPMSSDGAAQAPAVGMTIGRILDCVVRLVRSGFRLYLGLALAPAVTALCAVAILAGLALLSLLPHLHDGQIPQNLWFLLWLVPPALFLYFAVFVVYALYSAAVSHAVVHAYQGHAVTIAEAWSVAWRRGERYVWLMFLLMLILAGPVYLVFGALGSLAAIFAFSAAHANPVAPFLLFALSPMFMLLNLGAQVYMVLMFLRFGLAIPACVMENLPAAEALKRSVALTRGAKGRIFVVLLVMYAASFVLIMACEIAVFLVFGVGAFLATLMGAGLHSPAVLFFFAPFALLLLLIVILALITLPYVGYTTALGVLYCDQKERLDAEATAAQTAPATSA
jgi:hypothetical protein